MAYIIHQFTPAILQSLKAILGLNPRSFALGFFWFNYEIFFLRFASSVGVGIDPWSL
jgi:hypothetical protein